MAEGVEVGFLVGGVVGDVGDGEAFAAQGVQDLGVEGGVGAGYVQAGRHSVVGLGRGCGWCVG